MTDIAPGETDAAPVGSAGLGPGQDDNSKRRRHRGHDRDADQRAASKPCGRRPHCSPPVTGVVTAGGLRQRVYLGGERLSGGALVVGAERVSFSAALTPAHAGARVPARAGPPLLWISPNAVAAVTPPPSAGSRCAAPSSGGPPGRPDTRPFPSAAPRPGRSAPSRRILVRRGRSRRPGARRLPWRSGSGRVASAASHAGLARRAAGRRGREAPLRKRHRWRAFAARRNVKVDG